MQMTDIGDHSGQESVHSDRDCNVPAAALAKLDVKLLFPTPFVVAEVDGAAEINTALRDLVMARSERRGVSKSNVGGWQSDEDFLEWGGEHGQRVLRAACDLAHALTVVSEDGELRRAAFQWRVGAWANVNRPGDSNVNHGHPGSFWSGTYYVEDGTKDMDGIPGGTFEMLDPRGIVPQMYAPNLRCGLAGCATAGLAEQHQPRAGQLTLFPSWLIHCVTPYRGYAPRISISFNLSI